ncbi:kinesin-like protein KIF6 [Sinocyclocheilus anshuiensis]|uniref:kinesin-like protein KIF6 n=1 Tax=Sinocyclocheilus anshuiensis TaxID=1608454 RepID=UPI0007B8D531|nr:PREDICTED: kinesin-like protein KIF6 [Sinocyclocheilus anshuiensis]
MVKQTIQIFARVKPTKNQTAEYFVNCEEQGGSLEFVVPRDLADGVINNKRENYKFRFQNVFDQTANQEEIFEAIAKPVADNVLAGYNGTIFAYGQTGSGKTFTITGGAEHYNDRGIIPRTLSYLYQHFSKDSSMIYTTHISYLEIYNETGYDLLNPQHEASHLEDLPKVTIMEDPDQNIHLKNLSLQQSANEEEALDLLFLGDTNRMIAETPINQASTRSHCIFTIHLCSKELGSAMVRCSKLHLVDLAGSERVGKSGVGGQILTEAKYINLSLHYLEQVIIALSEKNRSHIPYRNSMMTSVLRDSLGGNCMTTMIAAVSVERRNTGFLSLQVRVREGSCAQNGMSNGSTTLMGVSDEEQRKSYAEVQKLRDMLTHRDNEISILVNMLKKEKKKGQDVSSQLALLYPLTNKSSTSPTTKQVEESAKYDPSNDYTNVQHLMTRKRVLELSVGQQEAFEVFLSDHEDRLSIENNRAVLQQRFIEAKTLGEQVNQIRIKVNELKTQLKIRRKQMVAQGLAGNLTASESDSVEERILNQIEEEKKNYKIKSGCLKGLKTEIEHLQLLHEKLKVKLQKDFENWWTQEGARLKGHSAENTGSSQSHVSPLSCMLTRAVPPAECSSTSIPLTGDKQTDDDIEAVYPDTRANKPYPVTNTTFRAVPPAECSSTSIPLTGDKQTDDDIEAFIRARHNLLNSTGVAK